MAFCVRVSFISDSKHFVKNFYGQDCCERIVRSLSNVPMNTVSADVYDVTDEYDDITLEMGDDSSSSGIISAKLIRRQQSQDKFLSDRTGPSTHQASIHEAIIKYWDIAGVEDLKKWMKDCEQYRSRVSSDLERRVRRAGIQKVWDVIGPETDFHEYFLKRLESSPARSENEFLDSLKKTKFIKNKLAAIAILASRKDTEFSKTYQERIQEKIALNTIQFIHHS